MQWMTVVATYKHSYELFSRVAGTLSTNDSNIQSVRLSRIGNDECAFFHVQIPKSALNRVMDALYQYRRWGADIIFKETDTTFDIRKTENMPLRVLEITGADDTDVLNTVSFYFTKHRILLSELYMQQRMYSLISCINCLYKQ